MRAWNGAGFVEEQPSYASGAGLATSRGDLEALALTLDPNGNPFAVWEERTGSSPGLKVVGTVSPATHVYVADATHSIQSILDSYALGKGDVIEVRAGTYGAVTIGASDAGVTIVGQPGLGATLASLTIAGAADVTIQGVTVTGATTATGADRLALTDNAFTGGLTLSGGSNAHVLRNVVNGPGMTLTGASGYDVRANRIMATGTGLTIKAGNSGTIAASDVAGTQIALDVQNAVLGSIIGNAFHGASVGVRYAASAPLSGNAIWGNATGVLTTVGVTSGALGFAPGSGRNDIHDNTLGVSLQNAAVQNQLVRNNVTGLSGSGTIGGSTLDLANDVSGNGKGIAQFTGVIQFNRIDRNTIGIQATAGQEIWHNLIYRNTQTGLLVDGVSGVRTSSNTFYAPTGDNVRLQNGASGFEILNSILWARGGYDLSVANDSQAGFFSDYNTLYADQAGKLVYWTKDFSDILDWQADVALYDLHSVGTTVVHPQWAKPRFFDAAGDDFRVLDLIAGQRGSSPTLDTGSTLTELDVQAPVANLLVNAGFENGLIGWTTNPEAQTAVSGVPAYAGSKFYFAGAVAAGFAQQSVDLLAAGFSAGDIDSGAFDLLFGAYTRSWSQTPVDSGAITITLLDGANHSLGTMTVQAPNSTSAWGIASGRIALAAGTRQVLFHWQATRNSGSDNDAYFDNAFVSVVPHSVVAAAGIPGSPTNLLTNPSFEQGGAGWQLNAGATVGASGPAAFDGGAYFTAGNIQLGFARQTVDLLAGGLLATEIDAGKLDLVFGGRIRSAAEAAVDSGTITITFLAADGTTQLGTATVSAPNTTDRWALVGKQTRIPTRARFALLSFDTVRNSGTTADSRLDAAFMSAVSAGASAADGAYPAALPTSETGTAPGGTRIDLRYPDLYTDWEKNAPHLIQWQTVGNAGHAVKIELLQDTVNGPVVKAVIAASVTDTGSYIWIPASSGIDFGTYGLRIQVSLVGDPGVFDRSVEAFTVPESGSQYYVNDGSTAGDVLTTAVGSNRNDGKLASAPKANPVNVLRIYALGAGAVLNIDTGTYSLISPMHISGSTDYGLGLDEGFTITGPSDPAHVALLLPAIPSNRSETLLDLDAADFMTVQHLSFANAQRGVYVHNNSTNFNASWLSVSDMSLEGIRIESSSAGDTLDHLSTDHTGSTGIYLLGSFGTLSNASVSYAGLSGTYDDQKSGLWESGTIAAVTGGSFHHNAAFGLHLQDPGSVAMRDNDVRDNRDGLWISNGVANTSALVGDTDLSLGYGNTVHGNALSGITAAGAVTVAGNTVFGQTGLNHFGISLGSGASAIGNVVFGNQDGIENFGNGDVTGNRLYGNARYGLYMGYNGFSSQTNLVKQNVIYGNMIGLRDERPNFGGLETIVGNLIYGNAGAAVSIATNVAALIINNTLYQPQGDAIQISGGNANSTLRNNIMSIGSGTGIRVANDSQNGFKSDYNLFQVTAGGAIGNWQGTARVALSDWISATTGDVASLVGDPLFVAPTGADGVLGYQDAAHDGRDDDLHVQSTTASFHGGSFAPVLGGNGLPVALTGTSTADAGESPAIDRGGATDPVGAEPTPNGGFVNIGAYGGTSQASQSPTQYVLVLTPAAGASVQQGKTTTISWRSAGFAGAVDISYVDQAGSVVTIATGVANTGSYAWAVDPSVAAGAGYQIRVAASGDGVSGLSAGFTITAKIHAYYVNDGSTAGDQYTTAIGNDANDGLTAATPKATIQALLAAYAIGAGDTIYVDAGTYAVTTSITLTAANSGSNTETRFRIAGPTNGAAAILDRGNTSGGTSVFAINGASFVTLSHLDIRDAQTGISISGAAVGVQVWDSRIGLNSKSGISVAANAGATGLDVERTELWKNGERGIYVLAGNAGTKLVDVDAHDNATGAELNGAGASVLGGHFSANATYGLLLPDGTASVVDVLVYENGYGIKTTGRVEGAKIFDNLYSGIQGYGGARLIGNTVYGQRGTGSVGLEIDDPNSIASGNTVFQNAATGVYVYGGATAQDNRVFGNVTGIYYGDSNYSYREYILGNQVYGNTVGIAGSLGGFPGAVIENNTIYGNTTRAVSLDGGVGNVFRNNTVQQTAGQGIWVRGGATNAIIENDIFWITGGPAIEVAQDSETGHLFDYNLFYLGAGGLVGRWENQAIASLSSWVLELSQDRHSGVGNPGFVAPAGADGIMGYAAETGVAQVVDAGGAGFASSGTWTTFANGYGGSSLQSADGAASASWTVSGLSAGQIYEVGVSWPANYGGFGRARFTVRDANGVVLAQGTFSQYGTSVASFSVGGTGFQTLGPVLVTGSSLTVTIDPVDGTRINADAVALRPVGADHGLDDDFHLLAGSLAIDGGDPATLALSEPGFGGGRANIGADANTAEALGSAAQTLQVLSPVGLTKLTVGQQTAIDLGSFGLGQSAPVLLLNVGGGAVRTALQGAWAADAYGPANRIFTNGSAVTNTLGVPDALFASGDTSYGSGSNTLSYNVPAPDGSYTLRLYFADPSSSAAGQTKFDIRIDGVTVRSGVDVFQLAGGRNKALEIDLAVTVSGGKGLAIDLVATVGNAFLNAMELDVATAAGEASPTVGLEVSYDGGGNWQSIGTGIALNRFGQGEFLWTPNQASTGNTVMIHAAGANGVMGMSAAFLVAPAGHAYYVNDATTAGDQYSTAPGDDANSGKDAAHPMANLASLLRAYQIGAGDTVYVDTGTYTLPTDIVFDADHGADDAHRLVIQGPSNGGHAILARGNTSSGANVIDVLGASWITLANLDITGGRAGIYVTGSASGVDILGDRVYGNASYGIWGNGDNPALSIESSQVYANGDRGIYISGGGATAVRLINDSVHDNAGNAAYVAAGGALVQGGDYYDSASDGLVLVATDSQVIGVRSYGNSGIGISSNGLVQGSTAFANTVSGIDVGGTSGRAVGNTTYGQIGSGAGLRVFAGATAQGNRSYGNTGAGIYISSNNYSLSEYVVGNDVYGNAGGGIVGSLGSGVPGPDIERNLVYGNTGQAIVTGGVGGRTIGNTIAQTNGAGIVVAGGARTQRITDNILWVIGGPALSIAADSEVGLFSDFNLFDLGAGGTIALLQGLSYTTLPAWFLATGWDQNSRAADPAFVDPAGGNGVLGYTPPAVPTSTVVDQSSARFGTSGTWSASAGGVGGGSLKASAGATASWTIDGLTAGQAYRIGATWPSAGSGFGNARFTVRDAAGTVLATSVFDQYSTPNGFTVNGTGYARIGVVIATGSTLIVTIDSLGSQMVADAVVAQTVASADTGADDDFHLQAVSPARDAGDLGSPFLAEPGFGGGRADLGAFGGGAQALADASPTLQVVSPGSLSKLTVGQPVAIDVRSFGLQQTAPVLLLNSGGAEVETATSGVWSAGAFGPHSVGYTNANAVTNALGVPDALFATGDTSYGLAGNTLTYALPAPDGTYTLRLFFDESSVGNVGQRVFDIKVNGVVVQANVDIFKLAGRANKAIEIDLPVTVSGGQGLAISLVGKTGNAFLNALELDAPTPGGQAAPTVDLEASFDNGAHWQTIGSGITLNRFGQGEFLWAPGQPSAGNVALIRATAANVPPAISAPFLVAPAGHVYYVNDGSKVGDQYTTAAGDDLNSGKDAAHPMASLGALLRAYQLGAGDTVYVDTGSYTLPTDLVFNADHGTDDTHRLVIQGPTGNAHAVLSRGNVTGSANVIDMIGASWVTLANLDVTGGYVGLNVTGGSVGVEVLASRIYGNANVGVYVGGTGNNTGFGIEGSQIYGNGDRGLWVNGAGNGGARLLDDEIYDNGYYGADLNAPGAVMQGGSVHGNHSTGVVVHYADGLITGASVFGNGDDGIFTAGTVIASTVYGNAHHGIEGQNTALITGNDVYGQNAGYAGIYVYGGSVAGNNTVHGNAGTGILVGPGSTAQANRVYANAGAGIFYTSNSSYQTETITANQIYSNAIGITGDIAGYQPGPDIENNLIYANANQGVILRGTGGKLVNNTIYQSVGQAVVVQGSATKALIENNIVWSDLGTLITVAADSQSGFVAGYNLYYRGAAATANVGSWGNTTAATLAAWQAASGQDKTGTAEGNPNFIDIDGADNVLGGPGSVLGGGADDNFGLKASSTAIDSGNAYVAPLSDAYGRPRHDDPGSANTGTGYNLFLETITGSSSFTAGGTAMNWRGNGGSFSYTLPFAFSFYGTSYTSVSVSSHGFLRFAGPDTYFGGAPTQALFLRNAVIAPLWADINTYGGDIYVTATANAVTFRWAGAVNANNAAVNVSVTLFADGTFRFDYGAGNAGLAPIVGVSAGNGNAFVLSSYNGSGTLGSVSSLSWAPSPGLTYYDIGAFEFQGDSGDVTPPKVTTVSNLPASNGATALAFTNIAVDFSESLDLVSARSPANYKLVMAGADGVFDTVDDVAIALTPAYSFPQTNLTLSFGKVLADGKYRLTLSGTNAILDTAGNKLAGDGTNAGTDYVRYFTVDRSTNHPPVATPQSITLLEGGSTQITLAATDADGDPLTYSLLTNPAHGTLSALDPATHTLIYTPDPTYYGADSFSFGVDDGKLGIGKATIGLTVQAVNQAPTADAQSVTLGHDRSRTIVLTGSDAETQGSNLVFTIVDQPTHGTLTAISPGVFSYMPVAGYVGSDSFTFTVTDTGAPSGTASNVLTSGKATVSLTIAETAPTSQADGYAVLQGGTLTVGAAQGVLANDGDAEGDALSVTPGQVQPAHGTLTLNADGSFTYTPDPTFSGTDSFSYVPSDGLLTGAEATVTVTVQPFNHAPNAAADAYVVLHDRTLVVSDPAAGVLANDADPDGNAITAVVGTGPTHGHLTLNQDGTFTYTPDAGYVGSDAFTYTATDGSLPSQPATVTITVGDTAPSGQADAYQAKQDVTLVIAAATGVLANDGDADGDALTATVVAGPAHGTLQLGADGSFSYTPAAGYHGADSFTYAPHDGALAGTAVTVSLSVAPAVLPPVAADDAVATTHDHAVSGNVTANDTDPQSLSITVALGTGPAHGTLDLKADGSFTYTPDAGFHGADAFTYTDANGAAVSAAATVSITVAETAPAPGADSYALSQGGTFTIGAGTGVLANDTDAEGDAISAGLSTGPSHGTLTLNADGSFTYTPDATFSGTDGFTYVTSDGLLSSGATQVTLTVTPLPASAQADQYAILHDRVLTVGTTGAGVLGNDATPSGNALSAVLATGPSHGTLTLNQDGTFTYTPEAGFAGTDGFTYVADDGVSPSAPATVTISVTDPAAPTSRDHGIPGQQDTVLVLSAKNGILWDAADADGDKVTAVLQSGPAHGQLVLNADGSLTYTPEAGFAGTDSFVYKPFDGVLYGESHTITLSLREVSPTAKVNPDQYTVLHDRQVSLWNVADGVLANDTFPSGVTATAVLTTGPSHGTLTLFPGGSIYYSPDAGFVGIDTFVYRAVSGKQVLGSATVTMTVVDQAPVANPNGFTISQGGTLTQGKVQSLLWNDSDADHDPLTAVLASVTPQHGQLVLNADGSFTYTPDAAFTGVDTFTYVASDGALSSPETTVAISVKAVPVAHDDQYTVGHDHMLNRGSRTDGVLANDVGQAGDWLSTALVQGPANGVLSFYGNGGFYYTPKAGFTGTDTFTYRVSDDKIIGNVGTVTISVTENAPVTKPESYTITQGSTLAQGKVQGLLWNDTDADKDPITAVLGSVAPAHGQLVLNADGSFTYTPDAGFTGTDSFTYTAFDGVLNSPETTVGISVKAVPVAHDDQYTVGHDHMLNRGSRTDGVLANDVGEAGDWLSAALVQGPANGVLSFYGNGGFYYTPKAGFTGTDTFTYRVSDDKIIGNVGTVTISVAENAPVAKPETYTIAQGSTLTQGKVQGLLWNDTDADRDLLTAVLGSVAPAHGQLVLNADGSFTYTPDAGFTGTDSFTYTAFDGVQNSAETTVTIGVKTVPVAHDDQYTVTGGKVLNRGSRTDGVLANDVGQAGVWLSTALIQGPTNGVLSFYGNGGFYYTPTPGFTGTDTFTYQPFDGKILGNIGTVTISVLSLSLSQPLMPVLVGNAPLPREQDDAAVEPVDRSSEEVAVAEDAAPSRSPSHRMLGRLHSEAPFVPTPQVDDVASVPPVDDVALVFGPAATFKRFARLIEESAILARSSAQGPLAACLFDDTSGELAPIVPAQRAPVQADTTLDPDGWMLVDDLAPTARIATDGGAITWNA